MRSQTGPSRTRLRRTSWFSVVWLGLLVVCGVILPGLHGLGLHSHSCDGGTCENARREIVSGIHDEAGSVAHPVHCTSRHRHIHPHGSGADRGSATVGCIDSNSTANTNASSSAPETPTRKDGHDPSRCHICQTYQLIQSSMGPVIACWATPEPMRRMGVLGSNSIERVTTRERATGMARAPPMATIRASKRVGV